MDWSSQSVLVHGSIKNQKNYTNPEFRSQLHVFSQMLSEAVLLAAVSVAANTQMLDNCHLLTMIDEGHIPRSQNQWKIVCCTDPLSCCQMNDSSEL